MKITINSILGGQTALGNFGGKDQFRASLGIDPAQPIDDLDATTSTVASGLLRPVASQKISGSTITSAPLWMKANPKDGNAYVYDANGSAYTISSTNTFTALSDGGSLTSSKGNGCEYYDNYMYFAKNTDICRYGPLNGSAAFNATYWTSTLSKAALTNTTYPRSFKNKIEYPNHVMCRHSDGKLYFTDVSGNQGIINYIRTTKVSVEGDTDNGSTLAALTFGYGLWPTTLESFGTSLAIGLIETSITNKRDARAKLALWDTTSTSFNSIIWAEFPDPLITAVKNVNGTLYVISGGYNGRGFRVSRYLGGTSFKEVYYSETGESVFPGAVEALNNQFLFGTHTTVPESDGCLMSIGLQKAALGQGVFNVMRATGGTSSTSVTSMMFHEDGSATPIEMGFYSPILGWTQAGDGSTGVSHGVDQQQTQYNNAPSVWWSQTYRIGQPFNITEIRIPFAQQMAANMTLTAKVYFDDGQASQTFTVINNTSFPSARLANLSVNNNVLNSGAARGEHSFWLELRWTGSALLTLALPITIELDVVPD